RTTAPVFSSTAHNDVGAAPQTSPSRARNGTPPPTSNAVLAPETGSTRNSLVGSLDTQSAPPAYTALVCALRSIVTGIRFVTWALARSTRRSDPRASTVHSAPPPTLRSQHRSPPGTVAS